MVQLYAEELTSSVRHGSAEDYALFLRQRAIPPRGHNLIKARARFVRAYPDLKSWFGAPLVERVGSTCPRSGDAYICAQARPYLYYLAYRGHTSFDWPWILAVGCHRLPTDLMATEVERFITELTARAVKLGYAAKVHERLRRSVKYLYLNEPTQVPALAEHELHAFEQALVDFGSRPDVNVFYGSVERCRRMVRSHRQDLFVLRNILYQRYRIAAPPKRIVPRPRTLLMPAPMEALLTRYLEARRALGAQPKTLNKIGNSVRHFADWMMTAHPSTSAFTAVTREHVLEYAASLCTAPTPDCPNVVPLESKISRLSNLSVFFHDTTAWGWADAPLRPLIGARDLPKRIGRIPRFIPAGQLKRLMIAVRNLACTFQRTALIVARWSGARRGEIRNLDLDCLDAFADGTPRLRIPAGKTGAERLIPLHQEAADAIRMLQASAVEARGFVDQRTSRESRRLFVRYGKLLSSHYLFESSLKTACAEAGLLKPDGSPSVTAHRFRHTVGTELAEGGARLHTIMKMLGHTSTGMTLVYAHLSDATVREDYLKVLGPGAQIAGPLAATLRAGAMPKESIDWLKANFFRTELELGHCLRLPQEGPCECDLYLTCAKFVTTQAYAPRLRGRRSKELAMVEDARQRGFEREAERHARVVARIEALLAELGERVNDDLPPAHDTGT